MAENAIVLLLAETNFRTGLLVAREEATVKSNRMRQCAGDARRIGVPLDNDVEISRRAQGRRHLAVMAAPRMDGDPVRPPYLKRSHE
jgi:hypothetical protein